MQHRMVKVFIHDVFYKLLTCTALSVGAITASTNSRNVTDLRVTASSLNGLAQWNEFVKDDQTIKTAK